MQKVTYNKRRNIIMIALALAFIVIPIIASVVLTTQRQDVGTDIDNGTDINNDIDYDDSTDTNDGTDINNDIDNDDSTDTNDNTDIDMDRRHGAFWEGDNLAVSIDSGQLRHMIGRDLLSRLESVISSEVLRESELATAPLPLDRAGVLGPGNAFDVILNADSLRVAVDRSPNTHSFNFKVSDGRTYSVYFFVRGLWGSDFLAVIIVRTDIINENSSAYIFYNNEYHIITMRRWVENMNMRSVIVLQRRI